MYLFFSIPHQKLITDTTEFKFYVTEFSYKKIQFIITKINESK